MPQDDNWDKKCDSCHCGVKSKSRRKIRNGIGKTGKGEKNGSCDN